MCRYSKQEVMSSSLSGLALGAYRAMSEIDCILVGMRQVRYVDHIVDEWKNGVTFELDWDSFSFHKDHVCR